MSHIVIISNKSKIGGPQRWLELSHKIFSEENVVDYYDENETSKYENITNSIIMINNCRTKQLFNSDFLKKIKKHNKLLFILHSDLCPTNTFFEKNNKYFDGVICVGKNSIKKVKKLYPKKIIEHLPNYVNHVGRKNKPNNKKFRIHFVGRLSYEKNIPMLIDAIDKNDDIELHLYGSSSSSMHSEYSNYELFLKTHAQNLGLLSDPVVCFFHDYTDNLDELYLNADCVIIPSVHEGTPYCMLESLSYDIPVIAHNVGSINEYIEHEVNGFLFNFDGINWNKREYKKSLSVDYKKLLNEIGYQWILVNNKTPNWLLTRIEMLKSDKENYSIGTKLCVPSSILSCNMIGNKIYKKNVDILKHTIHKAKQIIKPNIEK